jgi:hypothetical protein
MLRYDRFSYIRIFTCLRACIWTPAQIFNLLQKNEEEILRYFMRPAIFKVIQDGSEGNADFFGVNYFVSH